VIEANAIPGHNLAGGHSTPARPFPATVAYFLCVPVAYLLRPPARASEQKMSGERTILLKSFAATTDTITIRNAIIGSIFNARRAGR
jgi:hypothetical protein